MASVKALLKLHHDPHPWDDLWRAIAVEHPVRDECWDERTLVPLFDRVHVPAYVGCDWTDGPLHLPGSLDLINAFRIARTSRSRRHRQDAYSAGSRWLCLAWSRLGS
jgi:hypothetical protein